MCVLPVMGMASFTADLEVVQSEFKNLKNIYDKLSLEQIPNLKIQTLSMGMSGDYTIALLEGSNMIRIGSLLFGAR